MNKSSKIGIIGGYGFHNLGDDIQLYNNIRILKEKGYKHLFVMSPNNYIANLCNLPKIYPSIHSVLLLKNRKNNDILKTQIGRLDNYSKNYQNTNINLPLNEKKLINWINNIDILFVSGSGTINTRDYYGLMATLLPCIIAKNLNKKVILSGQGFLPLDNPRLIEIIVEILNKCDKIFTRDFKLGYKALKSIGINMDKVVLGIDDAFTVPPQITQKIIIPQKTIAINVSHFISSDLYPVFYNLAKKLKKEKYNPIFNYFQDDIEVAKVCSRSEFEILKFDNPLDTVYFYYDIYASIGMRYHSAILGLAGNHPVVNIYMDNYQMYKIKAIQEETNIPYFMINYKDCNINSLYDILINAIKFQVPYLKKINENWRNRNNLAIDYIEKS